MNIQVDKQKITPVYMQIVGAVRARIHSGELPDGSVLPSERVMAQMLGVHRNTVAKAYGELKADGLLHSRQGSGYTVAAPTEDGAFEAGGRTEAGKRVNWVNQIKSRHLDMDTTFDDLFERVDDEGKYSMGGGASPADLYDRERLSRDIRSLLLTKNAGRAFFTPYKGDRELRQKLVSFLSTKGIRASAGEIQVMQETNQALGYLVMLLVKPGDVVLIEEPVSPDVYRMMELAGGNVCCLPVNDGGIDCNLLEEMVRQKHPRLIFVNSSFHDPTGVVLSAEQRKRVVEISNTYRVPVVEEDAASELVFEGSGVTPLKAIDTLDNIIYIYSFSLSFIPGMQLAFVTAGKPVIESLSYLVSLNMATADWITQKLAAAYLEDGTYYSRLAAARGVYRRKRDIVCAALDELSALGVRYNRPRGGVYVWCRLPDGVDGKAFAARAYSRGVTVIPGNMFFPSKKEGRSYIRINYSHEPEDRLRRGMEILKETMRDILGKL